MFLRLNLLHLDFVMRQAVPSFLCTLYKKNLYNKYTTLNVGRRLVMVCRTHQAVDHTFVPHLWG